MIRRQSRFGGKLYRRFVSPNTPLIFDSTTDTFPYVAMTLGFQLGEQTRFATPNYVNVFSPGNIGTGENFVISHPRLFNLVKVFPDNSGLETPPETAMGGAFSYLFSSFKFAKVVVTYTPFKKFWWLQSEMATYQSTQTEAYIRLDRPNDYAQLQSTSGYSVDEMNFARIQQSPGVMKRRMDRSWNFSFVPTATEVAMLASMNQQGTFYDSDNYGRRSRGKWYQIFTYPQSSGVTSSTRSIHDFYGFTIVMNNPVYPIIEPNTEGGDGIRSFPAGNVLALGSFSFKFYLGFKGFNPTMMSIDVPTLQEQQDINSTGFVSPKSLTIGSGEIPDDDSDSELEDLDSDGEPIAGESLGEEDSESEEEDLAPRRRPEKSQSRVALAGVGSRLAHSSRPLPVVPATPAPLAQIRTLHTCPKLQRQSAFVLPSKTKASSRQAQALKQG